MSDVLLTSMLLQCPVAGMHPGGAGGPVGSAPLSQEQTAAAAANAAAVAAAAVLHHSGAEPSAETLEQARSLPRRAQDSGVPCS